MMIDKAERERFERLLPGYVCNRLNASDVEWLEQFVAAYPEMAVQVDVERSLRDVLRSEMPKAPEDQGIAPFMERIRADRRPPPSHWLRRFLRHFRESLALPMMKPAWATLGTLVVVQAGIIALLLAAGSGLGEAPMSDAEPAQWRSVGAEPTAAGPVLQLTFKPTATEADIRLLLVKIRGSIVAGPGQLGHYIVRVADGRAENIAHELQSHDILEAVEVLPELPKED